MCSGLGGCSGNISHFSACEQTAIEAMSMATCLVPPPPPFISMPFADAFPTTTLDTQKWSSNTGALVTPAAANERTAPNSLAMLLGTAVESAAIRTDQGVTPVYVSFFTERTGVEAGETLVVKYRNATNGVFQTLTTLVSDGADQSRFVFTEVTLPLDGYSANNGRIRFENPGNDFDDVWYVEDVSVSVHCRADVNKDRALTAADFGAFQTAFVAGNVLVADFNDDGVLTVADFGLYQTRFVAGCY
jgi:hypothetical protein